jgi:periplasmic protein TonB
MWSQTRPTLYASALSCALHILLLGVAASVLVALPRQSAPQLRVTLLQRAVPLPAQESQGAAKAPEPTPAPKPVPREVRRPQPPVPQVVAEKKLVRPVQPRPVKRVVQPRIEPPPLVKEEPVQTALVAPPVQPEPEPVTEIPALGEVSGTVANDDNTGSEAPGHNSGSEAPGFSGTGNGNNGNGVGAHGAGGPSATPDYNVNPKPPYPLIARRIGAQGEVLLRVLVRQDGSVASVELAQSSGFSLLDESATRTVRDTWRFIPARLDGAPVDSWVEVPIKFVLADS